MSNRQCSYCDRWRPDDEKPCPFCRAAKPVCEGCRRRLSSWAELVTADDQWWCGDCYFQRIRTRASKITDRCLEPACPRTVAQHIHEMDLIASSAAWREQYATRRKELA